MHPLKLYLNSKIQSKRLFKFFLQTALSNYLKLRNDFVVDQKEKKRNNSEERRKRKICFCLQVVQSPL